MAATRSWFVIAIATSGFTAAGSALPGQQPPVIPLRPGLTIVTAIANPKGDYETIKQVDAVDAEGVHFHVSFPDRDLQRTKSNPTTGSDRTSKEAALLLSAKRTILRADLDSARHYQLRFHTHHPEIFPGTTALGTSSAVLRELKSGSDPAFWLGSASSGSDSEELRYLETLGKRRIVLRRPDTKPITVSVLVNNTRVDLPAIHAKGRLGDLNADFYFLDDVRNPLALRWQVGNQGLEVTKISFPSTASAAQLASALEKEGRVEVYGIYFDVGSAEIKPESESVLQEIAGVLVRNPTWKLSVEGHTDNVGGDAYNLELSRQRAASVKDALVSRHRIAAQRLATAGFGASRPKEPNETLAGRARNRRVELVRR